MTYSFRLAFGSGSQLPKLLLYGAQKSFKFSSPDGLVELAEEVVPRVGHGDATYLKRWEKRDVSKKQ